MKSKQNMIMSKPYVALLGAFIMMVGFVSAQEHMDQVDTSNTHVNLLDEDTITLGEALEIEISSDDVMVPILEHTVFAGYDQCAYLYTFDNEKISYRIPLGSLLVGQEPPTIQGEFYPTATGFAEFKAALDCYRYDEATDRTTHWRNTWGSVEYTVREDTICTEDGVDVTFHEAYKTSDGIAVELMLDNKNCKSVDISHTISVGDGVTNEVTNSQIIFKKLAPGQSTMITNMIDELNPDWYNYDTLALTVDFVNAPVDEKFAFVEI